MEEMAAPCLPFLVLWLYLCPTFVEIRRQNVKLIEKMEAKMKKTQQDSS